MGLNFVYQIFLGMYSDIPVYDVAKRYGHRLCGLGIGEADHDFGFQCHEPHDYI